jgi:hypothetical protein
LKQIPVRKLDVEDRLAKDIQPEIAGCDVPSFSKGGHLKRLDVATHPREQPIERLLGLPDLWKEFLRLLDHLLIGGYAVGFRSLLDPVIRWTKRRQEILRGRSLLKSLLLDVQDPLLFGDRQLAHLHPGPYVSKPPAHDPLIALATDQPDKQIRGGMERQGGIKPKGCAEGLEALGILDHALDIPPAKGQPVLEIPGQGRNPN